MKKFLFISLLITPLFANAAINNLKDLITELIDIINLIIPLLFGIAILGFMWGVIKYIISTDVNKIKEARVYIFFSIVAIAVMLSVWSLAFFVKDSFFPGTNSPFDSARPGGGTSGGSNSGGNVLNICAGSYTTGAACRKTNGTGVGRCGEDGQCR